MCAQWLPDDTTDGLDGSALPLAAGQTPVALAQADGTGPNADAAFVPPGRCLYVDSTHRYLVADTGVRFGVRDAESAAALGLPPQRVPAPWPILRLLADGPELSRAAALVAHDGVAPDPRAIALPDASRANRFAGAINARAAARNAAQPATPLNAVERPDVSGAGGGGDGADRSLRPRRRCARAVPSVRAASGSTTPLPT